MERKCSECDRVCKDSEWHVTCSNGQGRWTQWCVSCAISILTDDGMLDAPKTPAETVREMQRHSKALTALAKHFITMTGADDAT